MPTLIVDQLLARPLGELLAPSDVAAAIRALSASDAARARVTAWLAVAARALGDDVRPLAQLLPPPLAAALRELVALPVTPRRATVEKVVDRPPVRRLVRAQVLAMLVDFTRRATSPFTENPIARGLRAFTPKPLKQAVSGEAERRAADFADTAVSEVLDGLAADLSDPSRAREQAEVRVAIVEGALAVTPSELVAPAAAHVDRAVDIAWRALAAWTAGASFEADIARVLTFLLGGDRSRPLGDVLADFGMREMVTFWAAKVLA